MRHQSHHIAAFIADPRDVPQRAIGIIQVAQHHAILALQPVERALIGEVAALAVRHRQAQRLAWRGRQSKRSIRRLHPHGHFAADEFQIAIAKQRAGKQPALHQNLKAVADAQHQSALLGEPAHRRHHRREFRDGSAAQIIAIGESAGKNHRVGIAQRGRIMPDHFRLLAKIAGDRVPGVVIAVAAGENDNAESHGHFMLPDRHPQADQAPTIIHSAARLTGPRAWPAPPADSTPPKRSPAAPPRRPRSSTDRRISLQTAFLAALCRSPPPPRRQSPAPRPPAPDPAAAPSSAIRSRSRPAPCECPSRRAAAPPNRKPRRKLPGPPEPVRRPRTAAPASIETGAAPPTRRRSAACCETLAPASPDPACEFPGGPRWKRAPGPSRRAPPAKTAPGFSANTGYKRSAGAPAAMTILAPPSPPRPLRAAARRNRPNEISGPADFLPARRAAPFPPKRWPLYDRDRPVQRRGPPAAECSWFGNNPR